MDWLYPKVLLLLLPALAVLFWCDARSTHPMGATRRRLLLVLRSLLVVLALVTYIPSISLGLGKLIG